jgi:hypothetical protein
MQVFASFWIYSIKMDIKYLAACLFHLFSYNITNIQVEFDQSFPFLITAYTLNEKLQISVVDYLSNWWIWSYFLVPRFCAYNLLTFNLTKILACPVIFKDDSLFLSDVFFVVL